MSRAALPFDMAGLMAAYADGAVTPLDATEDQLERIARLDGVLNSYVTVCRESALKQAESATAAWRQGGPKPALLGVPINVKDIFETAGIRTTCSSRILHDHVPTRDATIVARLRKAGAVLLGKANMLEFAYGAIHPDYGPAHNPWDPRRSTSGSSSGSAASVGGGLAYGSVGTDTGGSIRIPSAYCGLVGIKPTYGLVPRTGCYALSWSLDHVGPMTRTVRDAAILLQVLAGHDLDDPGSAHATAGNYPADVERSIRGLRVGVWAELGAVGVTEGVQRQFNAALAGLKDAGAVVRDVAVPERIHTDTLFMGILLPEATSIHMQWLRERPEDYASDTRLRITAGAAMPSSFYIDAQRYRRIYRSAFERVLQDVDVIVVPTTPTTAPIEGDIAGLPELTMRTAPFEPSPAGEPMISAPQTSRSWRRSGDTFSGMTTFSLYPFTFATRARPIPVFPDDGSRSV